VRRTAGRARAGDGGRRSSVLLTVDKFVVGSRAWSEPVTCLMLVRPC